MRSSDRFPRPAPAHGPAEDPWAVAERKSRAVEEPLDVVVLVRAPFPVLEVRNPLHRTAYRVMVPTWPDRSVALCTCPDFARRGLGTCKHIEAGTRWLERHGPALAAAPERDVDTGPAWALIDQRVDGLGTAPGPESLRWRAPGAALYETRPPGYLPPAPGPSPAGSEGVGRGKGRRSTPSPSPGRP